MADYDKLLQVPRGTKARLEQIKLDLLVNTLVYATDTKELGIKLSDGNIEYFMNATDINAKVDPNAMAYFNYAGNIYGAKYSLLPNAWESSLAVHPAWISEDSSFSNPRGTAQYPNGETEGVIISQSVTNIGTFAFYNWTSNNQPLVIPNSVTSIGGSAFCNWTSNNQPLIIPNSVTSIRIYAFDGWEANNQPLTIPNSVTDIRDYAFRNWRANTHPLVIPDSVTSIGNYAFYFWNSNNHPLIIPNSVTSIGNWAFGYWESVPYVEIRAITPPTLGDINAFANQNDAPIYVPDESVDDYKTATNWVNFANRIFPVSDMPNVNVLSDRVDTLETSKQDKLVAGDNITIDENTNVISASSDYYTKTEIDSMVGDIENALDAILGV